ncbi:MAG: ABC transporter permease [Ruminococcus sp.]|nr:ABC transporter permease [Ruminococcus sp.]
MKNPLLKRLPRELKSEFSKYLVIFIFMISVIGFVSGFMVASGSMIKANEESFDKYNIEDGNFELYTKCSDELENELDDNLVELYENFYVEKETGNVDSTLRIFKNRKDVNKICVMDGELPDENGEIAIDRMYADNNDIGVGDTLVIESKGYTVSGLVSFSDYTALYSSPSDMMFDSVKFGVATVTDDDFDKLSSDKMHYCYSFTFDDEPEDETQAKEMCDDVLGIIAEHTIPVSFIPQYSNMAITMVGSDLGNDKSIITMFLYVVVLIIAFIFAITTSNTITKEAAVIGTLRASGYKKREIIVHYLTMPMIVILVSAIVGNVLGYTVFKNVAASMYYSSFSLPTYETVWNVEAFLMTTVIPVIIMFLINFVILCTKLKLSVLKFLRRDLSKSKNKKAVGLSHKLPIMHRFRLRVIMQNMPNYITIVFGVLLANVILLFGIALPEVIDNYQNEIVSNMLCEYQYVLKAPVETETESAEKFSITSLETIEGELKSESVSVYGINEDNQYVDIDFETDGVYISNALAEKFHVNEGDTLTLKESYGTKEYDFKVSGVYYYPSSIAVFMDDVVFCDTFELESGYYNGYMCDKEIFDIDEQYVATKITEDDLTKTSRQMQTSMGSLMGLLSAFGVIMFMLIIYLLSKIIIEKNAQSISMTKVLGYSNGEMSSLYILSTTLVVVLSIVLTIPLVNSIMEYLCVTMLSQYPGYLPYYVPFSVFVKMALCGIVSYGVIAFFEYRKVKKIKLDIALKNRE